MSYADYDFYVNTYHGDVLTADNAAKWLDRASDYIDALTFRRTVNTFPVNASDVINVKKAVCAVGDALSLIDVQAKTMQATTNANGDYRGAIASISSGRESVHYVQGDGGSIYVRAACDLDARNELLTDVALQYLADVPDSEGVNLLYAGVK